MSILRLERGTVALQLLYVVLGVAKHVPDLFVGELAHHAPRRADHQRAVRDVLALGDQRVRADDALLAYAGVVEDYRLNPDQAPRTDDAAGPASGEQRGCRPDVWSAAADARPSVVPMGFSVRRRRRDQGFRNWKLSREALGEWGREGFFF